jgi:hypothetical protein
MEMSMPQMLFPPLRYEAYAGQHHTVVSSAMDEMLKPSELYCDSRDESVVVETSAAE